MASGRGLLFLAKVRRTTAFYFRRWNRIVVGVLFLSKISKFRFHNTHGATKREGVSRRSHACMPHSSVSSSGLVLETLSNLVPLRN